MQENEIRVGDKPKSKYIAFALHFSYDNNFKDILIKGLGHRESKAIEIAKSVAKLSENLALDHIEPFEVNGTRGSKAVLIKNEGSDNG